MRKKAYSKKQKRALLQARNAGIFLFALTMAAGSVIGLAYFARPSVSALENRNLNTFPVFSFSGVMDGSWFNDVSLWYSDTFPGREILMKASMDLKKNYGIQRNEQVMSSSAGDELPVEDSENQTNEETETAKKQYERTEVPDTYIPEEDVQNQIMQGTMVKDGAVYSACYFVQDSASAWFDVVNTAAKELEGITTVYSILLPNNSGAMLSDEENQKLGGTDQKQEIEYYYSNYNDLVHPVDTIDTLREHNDEYIYFRTDHHWTPLGAYYVYRNFCEEKGIEPADLDSFETKTFEPFYGSYASQFPELTLEADSVTGYLPKSTNTLLYYLPDETGKTTLHPSGEPVETEIFNIEEGFDQNSQYMRFIAGDQGFEVIDNPEIEDGSSCLIVKESFGNCFVPFLVDHYDKIYVADFRYNSDRIIPFCKEQQITDLILLNNIQLIGSQNVVAVYQNLLEP